MIRRPPRSTQSRSSAASDVYKRQPVTWAATWTSSTSRGPSWRPPAGASARWTSRALRASAAAAAEAASWPTRPWAGAPTRSACTWPRPPRRRCSSPTAPSASPCSRTGSRPPAARSGCAPATWRRSWRRALQRHRLKRRAPDPSPREAPPGTSPSRRNDTEAPMKILVCIKQVPDMESRFKPDGAGLWFSEQDLAFRVNEYDEYAVEEAVQLREQLGDAVDLTVLSIGPDRVVEALKKVLAMGCDRAVHVQDPQAALKDPWQIAAIIAAFARDKGFELIFTGMQSQDRGSAQVGVTLAEQLGIPSVTTIVAFDYADGAVTVKRELEGGIKGVVKLSAPALLTCQSGLNVPRYPTLPNIMKAKRKELLTVPVAELLHEAALATTASFHPPAKKGGGIVLEGDVAEMADQLIAILKERTTVLR